jgi:hypothetical protein
MDTKKLSVVPILEGANVVRLKVEGLRAGDMGYVHELSMPGLRSDDAEHESLLHATAYYTLQVIPAK